MDQLMDVDNLKKLTPEQQNQVLAGVKQQAAILNAQNLITELSEKCSKKCITNPGSSLSGGEKTCLTRCNDRFFETWEISSLKLFKKGFKMKWVQAWHLARILVPFLDCIGLFLLFLMITLAYF